MSKIAHVYVQPSRQTGVVAASQYSFNHPDFKDLLKTLFRVKDGESITEIEVDQRGITAYFQRT